MVLLYPSDWRNGLMAVMYVYALRAAVALKRGKGGECKASMYGTLAADGTDDIYIAQRVFARDIHYRSALSGQRLTVLCS